MEQDESSSLKKNDKYCWICHAGADESMPILIKCIECPRVYHSKCMNDEYTEGFSEPNEDALDNWLCVECQKLKNENLNQNTYKKVTPDQFNSMLSFAVRRLKYSASEPFQKEVDLVAFPQYNTFIVHPMYIGLMEQKIETKQYVSLEAVLQDTKWIVHNCTIFNGAQNKLTNTAKTLLKMIKHELSEIEVCPDCYLSSITKHSDQWFSEPCRLPHLLVFAKIKGFPFWPAKALKAIGSTDLDVRFFGAHDRSIVSVEKCYWLSKEYPANLRNHAMINMQPSVLELNEHIIKLEMKFGTFKYAPSLMPVDLNDPFVFIDAFKDINCLPSMAENTRNTRKRNFTTPTVMGQLPLISSFASTSSATTTTPTTLSKAKPTPTPTAISLSNQDAANRRRSNRTATPQASLTKKENQENDDSIQIAEDEDSEKLNSTTESTIPPDSNNEQQQQQQETNNNSINNRSKRLRKLSNKYSGFSVETIATSGATKRKSVRNSTSINSQSQQEQQQEITNEITAKKIRSDSDSNSKTSSSLVYVPKLTSSISSTRSSSNSESETIQSNPNNNNNNHNQINNYEKSEEDEQETQNDNESTCSSTYSTSDREKRKELKRREKKLLKEKNKLDKEMAAIKQTEDLTAAASSSSSNHSNFDQQMDSSCNSSSSIIVKIPRFNMNNNSNSGEDTSSILVSSTSNSSTQQPVGLSPIKIKISRQLQDGNKKSSSFIVDQASNSPTTITTTTTSTTNVPTNTPSSSSTQPTLPKLNIGELLNKCKQTLKQNDGQASEEQETNSESPNKEEKEEVKEVITMDTKECVSNEVINKSDHETISNNKEEEVLLETNNSNNETVSLDSTLETPTASNNNNSEQTLEPGEVPFRSLITTTTTTTNNGNNSLNGIQPMPKKNIIINTIMPIQQNKLRKIAPNLNQTSEPPSTIIIANSNNNNISSTKINLISNNNSNNTNIQNKTKREIELEKVIEEKNLKSREMKQFYEKLIREMKQSHELQQQQLIREIKYNCDLKISEVLKEASRKEMKLRVEYERKLNESKFKQWCSCCGKEAIYYCCWNTSYCDEECQKAHWGQHLKTCTRIIGDETNTADTNIKYNDSFTSNGTSYNNNNNVEYNHNTDSNGYDPLNKYNQRKQISQQQHKQQQNVQHLQQTPNNNPYQSYISSNNSANIQKKIQIPSNHNKYIINDQTTFAPNSSNNNNNNNPNRKVTL